MYKFYKHVLSLMRVALRRPTVISRGFGYGPRKGAVGTLRRKSGSRPSTMSVLGALIVAELALKIQGIAFRVAEPSRRHGKPHILCFANSPPPSNTSCTWVFNLSRRRSSSSSKHTAATTVYTCRLLYLLH